MSIACQKQPLNDGAHPYTTFGMASAFAQIACFGHSAVLQPWLQATMGRPGWHPYLDASRDPSGACFELRVGGFSHFELRVGGFSHGRAFVASAW
jgi:hypothetical protein